MDTLTRGYCPRTRLRFDWVDVTDLSRELEKLHLSGPAAARVLGQGLAAAGLVSADLGAEDETVTLQLRVDGPVGGALVEAGRDGALRGYTHMKILDAYDDAAGTALPEVFGQDGTLAVIQSTSRKIVYSGQVEAAPPEWVFALERYYGMSHQVLTALALRADLADHRLARVVGMRMEKMPDGDVDAFERCRALFDDGTARARLETTESLESFREVFVLPDLQVQEIRPLRFACRCSPEKIVEALSCLSAPDLRDMNATGETQEVTCHFCGTTYAVPPEQLSRLLDQRGDAST